VAALGDTLYVGDMGSAQLLVYSLSGKKLKSSLTVGSNPHALTVSADGKWAALATRGKNNPTNYQLPGPDFGQVSLLDAKGSLVATVWGRNQPTGLAFSADSKYLAFTDLLDNNVELYSIR
jgi:sugar lactone lactonase YvrE